jgi:predicted enzyme related to lactoylglutathione lyase
MEEAKMKLTFVYAPVRDLGQALAFHRDVLGWEEAWREGDTTVAFKLPDTDVEYMIDVNTNGGRPGPMFLVDSVSDFHAAHRDRLHFESEPAEIPGGYMLEFDDASGNAIYVLDQSTAG